MEKQKTKFTGIMTILFCAACLFSQTYSAKAGADLEAMKAAEEANQPSWLGTNWNNFKAWISPSDSIGGKITIDKNGFRTDNIIYPDGTKQKNVYGNDGKILSSDVVWPSGNTREIIYTPDGTVFRRTETKSDGYTKEYNQGVLNENGTNPKDVTIETLPNGQKTTINEIRDSQAKETIIDYSPDSPDKSYYKLEGSDGKLIVESTLHADLSGEKNYVKESGTIEQEKWNSDQKTIYEGTVDQGGKVTGQSYPNGKETAGTSSPDEPDYNPEDLPDDQNYSNLDWPRTEDGSVVTGGDQSQGMSFFGTTVDGGFPVLKDNVSGTQYSMENGQLKILDGTNAAVNITEPNVKLTDPSPSAGETQAPFSVMGGENPTIVEKGTEEETRVPMSGAALDAFSSEGPAVSQDFSLWDNLHWNTPVSNLQTLNNWAKWNINGEYSDTKDGIDRTFTKLDDGNTEVKFIDPNSKADVTIRNDKITGDIITWKEYPDGDKLMQINKLDESSIETWMPKEGDNFTRIANYSGDQTIITPDSNTGIIKVEEYDVNDNRTVLQYEYPAKELPDGSTGQMILRPLEENNNVITDPYAGSLPVSFVDENNKEWNARLKITGQDGQKTTLEMAYDDSIKQWALQNTEYNAAEVATKKWDPDVNTQYSGNIYDPNSQEINNALDIENPNKSIIMQNNLEESVPELNAVDLSSLEVNALPMSPTEINNTETDSWWNNTNLNPGNWFQEESPTYELMPNVIQNNPEPGNQNIESTWEQNQALNNPETLPTTVSGKRDWQADFNNWYSGEENTSAPSTGSLPAIETYAPQIAPTEINDTKNDYLWTNFFGEETKQLESSTYAPTPSIIDNLESIPTTVPEYYAPAPVQYEYNNNFESSGGNYYYDDSYVGGSDYFFGF